MKRWGGMLDVHFPYQWVPTKRLREGIFESFWVFSQGLWGNGVDIFAESAEE